MSDTNCPVCSKPAKEKSGRDDVYSYSCKVCGRFSITQNALHKLESEASSERTTAVISHAIRRMQKLNKKPEIDSKILNSILENNYLPSPSEQADNFILWLGDKIDIPGNYLELDPAKQRSIIGSVNERSYIFIINHLKKRGLLHNTKRDQVVLSFEGWNEYNRLRRRSPDGHKAFMAMPFGDDQIDKMYKDYFKGAVKKAGFELLRINEKPKAGLIDDRMRVEIRTSRFLIAELTNCNRGVYWEAGFAEGLGKPVIYTCERSYFENKGTHFDTNHLHTVLWEKGYWKEAADQLKTTIRATLPDEAELSD